MYTSSIGFMEATHDLFTVYSGLHPILLFTWATHNLHHSQGLQDDIHYSGLHLVYSLHWSNIEYNKTLLWGTPGSGNS